MAKASFKYPTPAPDGVVLELTIKEALSLRNYLLSITPRVDPGGQFKNISDALSSDTIFGPSIG